jgi:serine protease inhibitor
MKTLQKLKNDLLEKHLTPAEKTKREDIAQAIHRSDPGMPMAKKMAIATAQAKKVAEARDPREYDYEGDMAKSQLRSIIANAQTVHDMLEDDTNIAEWVQSKITLSADYISTVRDYMQSNKED